MDMPLCSGKWVRDNLLILDDLFTTTDLLYFYRFYGLTLQATSRLGLKLFDITKSNELKIRTVYEIRIKMRLFSIFRTAVLYKYRCHSLAPFLTCRQGRRRSQLAEAAVPERYATLVICILLEKKTRTFSSQSLTLNFLDNVCLYDRGNYSSYCGIKEKLTERKHSNIYLA